MMWHDYEKECPQDDGKYIVQCEGGIITMAYYFTDFSDRNIELTDGKESGFAKVWFYNTEDKPCYCYEDDIEAWMEMTEQFEREGENG